MEDKEPYISIIMNSRNDNYEGDSLLRLQTAIDNLAEQARQFYFRAELIIVEWNPPEEKPLLKNALSLPNDLGPLKIRFIVVPGRIHGMYQCPGKMKIVPVAALNVGIRRARGEFIWPTNSDLLFSNEMIQLLSLEKLDKKCFYRAFRYSVDEKVMQRKNLKERIDFCKNNIVQEYPRNTASIHKMAEHPVLQIASGGEFVVFAKEYWEKVNGYPEINNLGAFSDWLLCYVAYLAGLKEVVLESPIRIYHIDHKKHQAHRAAVSKSIPNFLRHKIYHNLDHSNPLRILMKHANNVKNNIIEFFKDIFFGYIVPVLKKFNANGSWDLNTAYSYWGFHKLLMQMLKGERSYVYNGDNWGLPQEHFTEFVYDKHVA